jgi:hypothetical protein
MIPMLSALVQQKALTEYTQSLPAKGFVRDEARVRRCIDCYGDHLSGLSNRAIRDKYGWKHERSAIAAIKQGEKMARELEIDTDRIKRKIHLVLENCLDLMVNQVREQAEKGLIIQTITNDGQRTVKKVSGIDPRIAGELGRGLMRWAQLVGMVDGDAGGGNSSGMTLINLQMPTDGASLEQRWASAEAPAAAVDVEVVEAPQPLVEGQAQE